MKTQTICPRCRAHYPEPERTYCDTCALDYVHERMQAAFAKPQCNAGLICRSWGIEQLRHETCPCQVNG